MNRAFLLTVTVICTSSYFFLWSLGYLCTVVEAAGPKKSYLALLLSDIIQ